MQQFVVADEITYSTLPYRGESRGQGYMNMEAQRHFLVSADATIALPLKFSFTFGRTRSNHMVLNDSTVSRHHAEVFWDGSAMVLNDLNSNNGTQVNGEDVTSIALKDGDCVQIGSHEFIYRLAMKASELEVCRGELEKKVGALRTEGVRTGMPSLPDSDFSGVLGATGLADICQMLELGQRSGLLTVIPVAGEKCRLYFQGGQVAGAEHGANQGAGAAVAVLQVTQGSFTFRNGEFPPPRRELKKTSALLLEALRLSDEKQVT